MSALTQFVRARLDEQEAVALAATPGPWQHTGKNYIETPGIDVTEADWGRYEDDGVTLLHGYRIHCIRDQGAWKVEDAVFIAANDPAVTLNTIKAHRTIVKMLEDAEGMAAWTVPPSDTLNGVALGLKSAVLCLAILHHNHPDFQKEWGP